jgi:signal transduction histidine kinase
VGVDAYHGYFAGLRNFDDTLILGRADYGWHQFQKIHVSAPLQTQKWYHLKFLVHGCWLAVSVRSELGEVASTAFQDTNCLGNGRFGLQSYAIAAAWRNVTVSPSTQADLDEMRRSSLNSSHGSNADAKSVANAWTDPRILDPMQREIRANKPTKETLPIAQLRLLGPEHTAPVTVRGVVTLVSPQLYIQDGSGGLIIDQSQVNKALQIGDTVDATGTAYVSGFSSALQRSTVRIVCSHTSVAPVSMTASRAAAGNFDGQFIEIEGWLTGHKYDEKKNLVLALEDGNQIFYAYIRSPEGDRFADIYKVGSRLRVRGICVTDRAYATNAAPFAMLLRSVKDAWTTVSPPWWNSVHIAELLGGIILLSILLQYYLAYVKRARLRAVIEERERLALEMHDTLAQSFAGIGLRLEALCSDIPPESEIHTELRTTVDLVRFGHREARRNIAALRPGNLEEYGLFKTLEMAVHNIIQNAPIQVAMTKRGEERKLPLRIADPLLRISQEAITNAVRHGSPKRIEIGVIYARRFVKLRIHDDGKGFSVSDPMLGFGIRGMSQRARGIDADFRITSSPGNGTTVSIRTNLSNRKFLSYWQLLAFRFRLRTWSHGRKQHDL